jgi:glycosyltransferase involved in cell wall biosynthesis
MPIYLDISPAVHAKAGLSRYADSLAQALLRRKSGSFAFFYNKSGDSHFPAWLRGRRIRSVHAGYKPWRMAVLLGQLARMDWIRLLPDCRLFHATEHLLLPLRSCRTVLTVHDLIFHFLPEHHTRLNRWYLNLAMPLYCRRADAIISVSEHSKADLMRAWQIDADKIHVVYEAADPRFMPVARDQVDNVRARYGLPERYILTVGTLEPRKNLDRLLEAVTILRRAGQAVRWVMVGGKGWLYHDFMAKLEASEYREAVVQPGFVPDVDLPAIYTGATLTVLPSLYEGFGLPVIESMACGTPVAASRVTSIPELGGEAVHYFDPREVEEMARVIGQIWRDSEMRDEMSRLGLARASQFSWEKAARETWEIYEKLGVVVNT